ncbi:protein phosphatase 1 regulatory subunit 35 isoform X2 [Dipodomys merriami]|uniref:protein phosphatase 1 regulatory subunit 35 isoform X2 n=1 Tax=Dipodomys merriami TaxID=94247 RepID=UPI003855C9FA
MMDCGESELESLRGGDALAAPGPPPEPRAPEPRVPVPEPGLDLSLSPRSESPEPRSRSPGRRKGQAGRREAARRGRQVRFRLAPSSPVRPEPPPAAPSEAHALEAPAPRSSLALSAELQAARAAASGPFDAAKAVEEQLRKSFQTRCGLGESVAEGASRARARHDHAVRPRHTVLRISPPEPGRAAPSPTPSPASPFGGHLPHAPDVKAVGSLDLWIAILC